MAGSKYYGQFGGQYVSESLMNTLAELEKAGKLIGLAFQIRDDMLDEIGKEEDIGKPVLCRENKQEVRSRYLP